VTAEDSVGSDVVHDAEVVEEDDVARDASAVEQDLDELLSARRERDEYLELAKRTKADFENYRKRTERDAAEAERRGRAGLVRELVPVLDNLERALLAAGVDPAGPQAGQDDGAALAQGVLLVYRDLRSAVERAGVETYDPAGESFDPAWHEALSTRPAGDGAPGTVLETVEKGYRLGDQVLRPARVIVSA
jgi:molecular chaperone GrpE